MQVLRRKDRQYAQFSLTLTMRPQHSSTLRVTISHHPTARSKNSSHFYACSSETLRKKANGAYGAFINAHMTDGSIPITLIAIENSKEFVSNSSLDNTRNDR